MPSSSSRRSGIPSLTFPVPPPGADPPLGQPSPESQGDFSLVGGDGGPPPSSVRPRDADSEGEDGGLSERDESLDTDGSLSEGDVSHPGEVLLFADACRVILKTTNADGSEAFAVCGRPAATCKTNGHPRKREEGDREEAGSYTRHVGSKGPTKHGKLGAEGFRPMAEVIRERTERRAEMERLAGLVEEEGASDGEVVDVTPHPHPSRDGPPLVAPNPVSRNRSEPQVNFARDLVHEGGRPSNGADATNEFAFVTSLRRKGATSDPSPWYHGLVHASGLERIVIGHKDQAEALVASGRYKEVALFQSHEAAEEWRLQSDNSRWRTSRSDASRHTGAPMAPEVTDSGQESSEDDSSLVSEPKSRKTGRRKAKKSKKKSTNKGKKRSDRRKSRARRSRSNSRRRPSHRKSHRSPSPSDSDDSSSSFASSSSSSSSSSSDSDSSTDDKRRGTRASTFPGPDPSVGDKKRVYGHEISDRKIDQAIGPTDMARKDAVGLYDCAVDVTGINGKSAGAGSVDVNTLNEEVQRTTDMAASLISSAIGKNQDVPHDTLWKARRRHALLQVKTFQDCLDFASGVAESAEAAFDRQDDYLNLFLSSRRYSRKVVRKYQQQGGLVRLTRLTYEHYQALLSYIQREAIKHLHTDWKNNPASDMVMYHSNKLLQIREQALNRKHLLLKTYAYLRDSNAKSFYHESMAKTLFSQMSTLTTALQDAEHFRAVDAQGVKPAKVKDTKETKEESKVKAKPERCNHCRRRQVHEEMGVNYSNAKCPLLTESQKVARAAAVKFVERFEKGKDDAGEVLKECVEIVS